jgi:hypothetical protein
MEMRKVLYPPCPWRAVGLIFTPVAETMSPLWSLVTFPDGETIVPFLQILHPVSSVTSPVKAVISYIPPLIMIYIGLGLGPAIAEAPRQRREAAAMRRDLGMYVFIYDGLFSRFLLCSMASIFSEVRGAECQFIPLRDH